MIRENLNPEVQIQGILPTMYDKRTLHSRVSGAIDILEENFGDLVFDTKIRKTIRFAEAPVKAGARARLRPRPAMPPRCTGGRRRGAQWLASAPACEGPLAELFRATEARAAAAA